MEKQRFFVTNLTANTTERDLERLFQDYGQVVRVELKKKENAVDEGVKIIAFVTLQLNECDVQYCLNELNWQKVNGAKIKVSIAKESFLDRLKREREEAAAQTTGGSATTEKGASEALLVNDSKLLQNYVNTRKTFGDGNIEDDEDIPADLLITRKRAAHSLQNGKIVIQSYDTTPIHVIENKKPQKQSSNKLSTSEQKRKQSVKLKTNQYKQNKSTIQDALADVAAAKAKKIKFSDSDEEGSTGTLPTPKQHTTNKIKNIFESEDEGEEQEEMTNFKLKKEHFGKKGEKLLQLQSKQSLDPRFRMDMKFVEDDEDDDDNAVQASKNKSSNKKTENDDADNERNWQMGILEQVVGRKLGTINEAEKIAKKKKMIRYDPTKEEDQKLLRQKIDAEKQLNEKQTNKKKKKNKNHVEEENEEITDKPTVSKDVFYVVNDTLAQSLKEPSEGFSLLSMFGKAEELEAEAAKLKEVAKEKILLSKAPRNSINPFIYDSSTDSDAEEIETVDVNNKNNTTFNGHVNGKKQKVKLNVESFFIWPNDERLKEGATFFRSAPKDNPEENYDEVRNRMKLLIKNKISKSKKKLKTNKH